MSMQTLEEIQEMDPRPIKRRTLEEIKRIDKEMLSCEDVAGYFGCDPQDIRVQAKQNASALGVPCIMVGSRVKFPKAGFVNYCEAALFLKEPRETYA